MANKGDVLRGMKDFIHLIDDEAVLKAYMLGIKQRLRSAQNIDKVNVAVSGKRSFKLN